MARTPAEIDIAAGLDRERLKDPYPSIEASRSLCPVAHQSGLEAYVLWNHADARELLQDQSHSRDPQKAGPGTLMRELNKNLPGLDANMLFADPPAHTRLRGLVSKAFTPRAVDALRPVIERWTHSLIDDIGDAPRFDLMEALARPLPTIVIAELLGVQSADHARFKGWSNKMVLLLNPLCTPAEREAGQQAHAEFGEYLDAEIASRRANPRDDLFTALIQVRDAGDTLTDTEVKTTCRLLLNAGNLTTTDLIGNGVHALLTHPKQLELLRKEPDRISDVVEEVLRWDPPVLGSTRVPTRDIELAGCTIPSHSTVLASLAGANRDPAVRSNAERFDIERPDKHHLSFGGGLHYCLGAHLARLEARTALSTLVQRFPKLRLAAQGQQVRAAVPGFRGFEILEVDVA